MAARLLLLLATACAGARLGDLARRDTGDIFTLIGDECGPEQCAEHGAGGGTGGVAGCACACPQRAPLFREDRELCVDDLPECSLATFGTGTGVQRLPFVYLPLKGQIIHPSKEITFQNVKTPICAVSGAQFLTRKGFFDLRNTLDADVPFKLFRDEGRTFLQWSGENEVRARMSGRLMIVRLLCRDVASAPSSPLDLRGVFAPCVAFRVQGTPPKHYSNVTEVQFTPNAQTSETSSTSGLSITEYVAIGISSLLLGLIYVASVFLFLHMRKRRKAASEEGSRRLQGLKKKDGSSITEHDIVRVNNERIQPIPNLMRQDEKILKKNPLLNINRQYQESKNFLSDSGSNFSDSEDFADSSARSDDNLYNNHTTAAIVHQHHNEIIMKNDNVELSHRDESGIERLPDEHVSIVETTDDREIARPVGTTRRKLYFNPAYFEPQLMAEPPPAALEFLVKIREVIAIAKHKMATKRFHPVLNQIPEEETFSSNGNSLDFYQRPGSQRSESVVSLKRENSRRKNCVGCPGCRPEGVNDLTELITRNIPSCSNCQNNKGDKQTIIRQWLETIPTTKQTYNESIPTTNQNSITNFLQSIPNDTINNNNNFTDSNSFYLTDNFPVQKAPGIMSVKSDSPLRNKNVPLTELEHLESYHNNYNYYCPTIGQVDAINPIGLSDYRPSSFRSTLENLGKRLLSNKSSLPDMVNEAIALEHCYNSLNQSSSDEEKFHSIKPNTNNHQRLCFTRNNTESHIVNDYETDSLERNSNKKGLSTPTEYPEVSSSQASPSLSTALPLEEELTMRNAVYKTNSSSNSDTPSPCQEVYVDQNHYETIGKNENQIDTNAGKQNHDYSLVSEVYVNNNYNFGSAPTSPSSSECSIGSRKLMANIKNSDEKPGCLTIEVKDSPENYIKIHESDGFEPDTLERKHQKQKEIMKKFQFSREELLKNIEDQNSPSRQLIQLRSSGTFTKTNNKIEYSSKFHSLRNDYEQRKNSFERPKLSSVVFSESKSLEESPEGTWEETSECDTEDGRILTLELRHSKRQRQVTPPTITQVKNLARPDILPPLPPTGENPIYEQPVFPPRRVEIEKTQNANLKNFCTGSLIPRIYATNITDVKIDDSISIAHCGPSSSPMRASVQSSSEYENDLENLPAGDICSNFYRRYLGNAHNTHTVSTDTFVKGNKYDNKPRFRRNKGPNVQDSGYLSSDSTNSQQVQKKLVVTKKISCSESDDTENEARSESGAESVETHSVFFDHFRKPLISDEQFNNSKHERDSKRNQRLSDNVL